MSTKDERTAADLARQVAREYRPYEIGLSIISGLLILSGGAMLLTNLAGSDSITKIAGGLELILGVGLLLRLSFVRIIVIGIEILGLALSIGQIFSRMVAIGSGDLTAIANLASVAVGVALLIFLTRKKTKQLFH